MYLLMVSVILIACTNYEHLIFYPLKCIFRMLCRLNEIKLWLLLFFLFRTSVLKKTFHPSFYVLRRIWSSTTTQFNALSYIFGSHRKQKVKDRKKDKDGVNDAHHNLFILPHLSDQFHGT